jgi:hypothetical protein
VYFALLAVHSLLRWIALALGVLAVASALGGGPAGRRRALPFVIAVDLQVISGALLWLFLSPLTASLKDAMAAAEPRYFAAEHPVLGLMAVGCAHAGNVLWKKGRQRVAAGLLLASLLACLATVPWFRPLLRV